MNVRALGFHYTLHDGLTADGFALEHPGAPDATILCIDPARVERASADDSAGGDDDPVLAIRQVPGHGWLLRARDVGAALVSPDGRTVWCAPQPGNADWPALVSAQIVPLVATVRGFEVFHASGVVHHGRAYLLCAARGVGKTSLAVQLVLAGARLLSDDVVAVDETLTVHPGATLLNLRDGERDNVERHGKRATLTWKPERHGRVGLELDRLAGAHPLGGIYLLERAPGGPAVPRQMRPRATELLGATFSLSVRTPDRLIRQLDLCARIAATVPVFQVRISPDQTAPELAAVLLAQMGEPARALA